MRTYLNLMEAAMRLPTRLYHGTSRAGWEGMKADNAILAMDDLNFVSFTEDYNTAFTFARTMARKFGEQGDGVLVILDGPELAQDYILEPCHGEGAYYGQKEWRVPVGVLKNVSRYVLEVEDNSQRGDLHEGQTKQKMRPDADDIRAIEKVRIEARRSEGGGGMCHMVSEWIEDVLGWERVSGTYLSADGEPICGGGHLWNILPDGAILDATADQFGEGHDIRVIEPSDPDWSRYDVEWYEDYNPHHEDFDPNWDRQRRSPDKFTGEVDYDHDNRLSDERGDHWWVKDRTHIDRYLAQDKAHREYEGDHVPRWDKAWAYGAED